MSFASMAGRAILPLDEMPVKEWLAMNSTVNTEVIRSLTLLDTDVLLAREVATGDMMLAYKFCEDINHLQYTRQTV
jgi:hypothetical protein